MALQMLGSKYCIDSLREDVTDLQEAVIDVFSRTGPVRVSSWKYPDKTASELDMTELLELYDYSDDEEDRQIAHIVLLELVIDRLILLLQSMSKFMDQGIGIKSAASPMQNTNNTSIGLVVKKYWNKLVHTEGVLTQANAENKQYKRKMSDLENSLSKETTQRQELQAVTKTLNETLRTTNTPFPLSDVDGILSRATSAISISRDECIKSTQTIETAFVPCESCDSVQQNFRKVGASIVHMCQQQGLPSNLVRFKKSMEGIDWMTANDVTRWAVEQNNDLNRLNKYLSDFNAVQEELRSEKHKLKESHKKNSEFDKEIKLERETQATQRKHYENKIQTVEKNKNEAVCVAKRQTEEVQRGKRQLEAQLGELKEQLVKQENMVTELETAKQNIEDELECSRTNNADVKRLEKDISQIESTLHDVTDKLRDAQHELSKEKVKNRSSEKHTQSVQGKQDHLLQRLDDLDRENDDLRTEVAELEEAKEKLQENLENAKDEKRKLKEKQRDSEAFVLQLKRDKEGLEESMVELQSDIHRLEATLEGAREREKLLVEYPDLNGPVNPDIQGTGDLATDMENQVKANAARIRLLEEQNTKLRNTITKVLQARQQQSTYQPSTPVPLWRTKTPIEEEGYDSRNVDAHRLVPTKKANSDGRLMAMERVSEHTAVRESFVIGKGGGKHDKSKSNRSRPASATKPPPQAPPSSIAAYSSLKKSGLMQKVTGRSSSRRNEESSYARQDVYTCTRCDKIYTSSSDLDIHKSYCRV